MKVFVVLMDSGSAGLGFHDYIRSRRGVNKLRRVTGGSRVGRIKVRSPIL